ncbi:MAG: VWA domain-containing protein [Mycoplasmataceae bacterium]|nr:VWA domain-containing protein [Mycoplasmataceae bacterium]
MKDKLQKQIISKLNFQKEKLLNEIKTNNIQDKELKDEAINKINQFFMLNKEQFSKSLNLLENEVKYLSKNINNQNTLKVLDYLFDQNIISKKRYENFKNFFAKNANEITIKIKNIIDDYIESNILLSYFLWFDSLRSKFIKELINKMKMIEEMTKGIKAISDLFGNFWDLSIHDLYKMNIDFIRKLNNILKEKEFITKIAELLGRLANSNNQYEEQLIKESVFVPSNKKTYFSPENTMSIKLGNDIQTILKYQLALRHKKSGKKIFNVNYAEKKLLELDQKAKLLDEKEVFRKERKLKQNQKGPFVMCIDTSGSMHGEPEVIAKALSLAIIKIANKQKRKCYIINFSTSIIDFDATNINKDFKKLYDFLSMSFSGGTDIEPALEASIKKVKEKGYKNADIIIVSDFIVNNVKENVQNEINIVKKNKVRLHALCIGNSQIKEHMLIFDSNWIYDGTKESIDNIIYQLNNISNNI